MHPGHRTRDDRPHPPAPHPASCSPALAACADDPTGTPPPEAPEPGVRVEGLYQITLTGLGGPDVQASAAPAGPALWTSPVNAGLTIELLSSGSFTEGTRGQGGHRYVNFTYRVRNGTGAPLSNLTLLPASTASTIPGTPFTSLTLFNGGGRPRRWPRRWCPRAPLRWARERSMRATDADVLQVFEESEIAAIALPAGVTGMFPYGFVVARREAPSTRTLPPSSRRRTTTPAW